MKKILLLILVLSTSISFAVQIPRSGNKDPRIKTIIYNSRDVFAIQGHYGFATTIEFASYERIENISIGDSLAWQVSPNSSGNLLFIKPIEDSASTNLTVVTDHRLYNFELTADQVNDISHANLTFNLRFVYPDDDIKVMESIKIKQKAEVIPGHRASAKDWNMEYSFKGSKLVAPIRTFDDGMFTYFKFNPKLSSPAIFLVDEERNESLLNYHIEGDYIVVQRIARQFTVRDGNEVACVFNEKYFEKTLVKSHLKHD